VRRAPKASGAQDDAKADVVGAQIHRGCASALRRH
jgi:hypothetical protein